LGGGGGDVAVVVLGDQVGGREEMNAQYEIGFDDGKD
jgi:hypothetical protein